MLGRTGRASRDAVAPLNMAAIINRKPNSTKTFILNIYCVVVVF